MTRLMIAVTAGTVALAVPVAAQAAAPRGQGPAAAQTTVQSLLAAGYAVVSSFPSAIGPGIFLQKADSLYLCFISETPQSADLRTDYCKPVR